METLITLPAMFCRADFMPGSNTIKLNIEDPKNKALVYALAKKSSLPTGKYTAKKFKSDFILFLCQNVPSDETPLARIENELEEDYDGIGLRASIKACTIAKDNEMLVSIKTFSRVLFRSFVAREPFFIAKVEDAEEYGFNKKTDRLRQDVLSKMKWLTDNKNIRPSWLKHCQEQENDSALADVLIFNFATLFGEGGFKTEELRVLFCELNINYRLEQIYNKLEEIIEELMQNKMKDEITEKAHKKQGKAYREYQLTQQKKAILKELGEEDEDDDFGSYTRRIKDTKMPEDAEIVANKQLTRLKQMSSASPESTVVRTYLDWLCDLPWSLTTEDNLDIPRARKILDEDHYDLEKVKKRIIEALSVRKLNPGHKSPILCLIGPPGVGKTSLGKSVARAMNRNFVRASLGGVRDEAEVRGHRRTYVGALPGRIIQGMKKAGSKNPVFVLDELDKLASDFRGDPSAALLEALDPEQNHAFSDHYLELSFDLSQVLFLCTANYKETIPPALFDRLEVIELPGYTFNEKILIAKLFLIPKQLEENGLSSHASEIKFTDEALMALIEAYTYEAGVRNLEREIATVLRRGLAVPLASGKKIKTKILPKHIEELLGPPKFDQAQFISIRQPGIVNGLAFTEAHGEVIRICATKMPGKGRFVITGRAGTVMSEAAQVALSVARIYSDKNQLEINFAKSDIHLQYERNAVPKEGPSAGAASALCIISLLEGKKVRSDMALTGEINLRGHILPVGGIKSKVLAAERAKIKNVLVPKQNEKDLTEIPEDAKENINIILVKTIQEVIDFAFLTKT